MRYGCLSVHEGSNSSKPSIFDGYYFYVHLINTVYIGYYLIYRIYDQMLDSISK